MTANEILSLFQESGTFRPDEKGVRRTYQGMLEMMEATGYKSRTSFRRRLLIPLLESELLEPQYPDKPNTPKQRYRSTIY